MLMRADHVILLHGLCRTARSMRPMADALTAAGFVVHNLDYPSRRASIDALSERTIAPVLAALRAQGVAQVSFVAHSLGGILIRGFAARHGAAAIRRVVMLGPPNQGSEVVDRLRNTWLFQAVNGAAGAELGTSLDARPNTLGPVPFETGVIAGRRSINWINSLMIPGPNDGKVSVARTNVAGQRAHLVLPVTHPFMMRAPAVIAATISFLRKGRFD